MASRTRDRVNGATTVGLFNTFETVPTETRARRATSVMVTRRLRPVGLVATKHALTARAHISIITGSRGRLKRFIPLHHSGPGTFKSRPSVTPGPRCQHRRHLPRAATIPRPFRGREHLHVPPAAEAGPPRRYSPYAPRSTRIFDSLGMALNPDRLAEGLSIADRQLAEIAKALLVSALRRPAAPSS